MSPVYQYRCEKCGIVEERFQKSFNAEPAPVCSCGQIMNRKISVCNHTFGWDMKESSYIKGNPIELERKV